MDNYLELTQPKNHVKLSPDSPVSDPDMDTQIDVDDMPYDDDEVPFDDDLDKYSGHSKPYTWQFI